VTTTWIVEVDTLEAGVMWYHVHEENWDAALTWAPVFAGYAKADGYDVKKVSVRPADKEDE